MGTRARLAGGDGGICGGSQSYEAISLWRDASVSDLVDDVKYGDRLTCSADMCEAFGKGGPVLPVIPPLGYGIVSKQWSPCCPYQALSASPTPGGENLRTDLHPVVRSAASYSQNVVEIFFSEPMDAGALARTASFSLNGEAALAAYPSLSREKVLLLFGDAPLNTSAALEAEGLVSWAGVAMLDTTYALTIARDPCTNVCDIQAYDSDGYSPLNGKTVTMFGFITVPPGVFQPSYQSIYVQGLDGCGANVFSYAVSSPRPRIGDFVSVTGLVTEYVSAKAGSTTEISMPSERSLAIVSRAYPEPEAPVLGTGAVNKEVHEGKLIQTEGAVVNASAFGFYLDDGSGGVQVYQNFTAIDFTRFQTGMYVRVKGVVLQYDYTIPFLEGYELVPRYDSDIEIIKDAFPATAVLAVDAHVFCPSCGDDGFPIRFGAPSLSSVTLRVFDAAGRLISTLFNGASIGEREIVWRGTDGDGKPLPPGLYVCHFEAIESVSGKTITETVPIVIGTHLR